ncbi:hypothetical protein [Paraburkholderia sp. BCC1876]|uniref:hypothetical protein n=1 Tax=Paraburkholderia sp. BCC1876 TaxID=2676303 RepID=UPI001590681E|nr:hypothetical protein [Paraburkholderia sp. BCC1876]
MNPLIVKDDRELIDRLSVDEPIEFARYVADCERRLHSRMSILRAAQTVLESCDDQAASGLHEILVAVDMSGSLPGISTSCRPAGTQADSRL